MCAPDIYLSPSPASEVLYMLCFKNQFKNKKDEGGCNLLPSVKMRYSPQAPAKLLISPQFGPAIEKPGPFV